MQQPPEKSLRFVAEHDRESLAALLRAVSTRSAASASQTAAAALRCAFKGAGGDALASAATTWTAQDLQAAGIGRWAHAVLLELQPTPSLHLVERSRSRDGTIRLLFSTGDGSPVESVLIPSRADRQGRRMTLCVSSQAGCARGCTFCETGQLGLLRQLTAAEIVDQYRLGRLTAAQACPPTPAGTRDDDERLVSNVVFMGMGEPLDNFDAVVRAIRLLSDQHAFAFPPSRITVSTAGVADKLKRFFTASRAELAVSLNAPDDERRSAIMPINIRFDLATLRRSLIEALPARRRVLVQYALFDRFNDAPEDADRLAEYVRPISCRLNLIPANPGPDRSLRTPAEDRVEAFLRRLHQHGVRALLRHPRGRDVGGGCGQLAGKTRPAPQR